jgi:hypothetical protein
MKQKTKVIWGHVREHSPEQVAKMKKYGHCANCTYSFLKDGRIKITVFNEHKV